MAQPNLYRQCVGCGTAKPKNELLRIVKFKNGTLEIDINQNKQGRGAYICPTLKCAQLVKKNRGLNRSFKTEIDNNFYDKLLQQVTIHEY